MSGHIIHFDRRNIRSWSRRARAADRDDAHQADVSRRIRLLQARALGNSDAVLRDDAPLIPFGKQYRRRDLGWRDFAVIVCTLAALVWWSIVG